MDETDETDERNESGRFFQRFFHGRTSYPQLIASDSAAELSRHCRDTVATLSHLVAPCRTVTDG